MQKEIQILSFTIATLENWHYMLLLTNVIGIAREIIIDCLRKVVEFAVRVDTHREKNSLRE